MSCALKSYPSLAFRVGSFDANGTPNRLGLYDSYNMKHTISRTM